MRRYLREMWPVAAVVASTLLLALQIPRKSLFPSVKNIPPTEPFAEFVSFGAEDYRRIVANVRMAWQVRARTSGAGSESRAGAFDFDVAPPPPVQLPLDASFAAGRMKDAAAQDVFRPDRLLPPTRALDGLEGLRPPPPPSVRPDADLLTPPAGMTGF